MAIVAQVNSGKKRTGPNLFNPTLVLLGSAANVLRIDNGRSRMSSPGECQDIEGIELHFMIMPARMQRVAVRRYR